jgi:hypothetical protein
MLALVRFIIRFLYIFNFSEASSLWQLPATGSLSVASEFAMMKQQQKCRF